MTVDGERLRETFAPHFDAMRAEDRDHLAEVLEEQDVPAGTRLLRHGRLSDRAYLIVRGEVEVTLDCPETTLRLGRRPAGSWVGELGMIDPGPASANVDALTDLHVWILTHPAWNALRRERPAAAASLTELICRDVAMRLRRSDALTFRREGPRLVLALPAERPREGLLEHMKHLFGLGVAG